MKIPVCYHVQESESSVEIPHHLKQQYSNSKLNILTNSNSTVTTKEVLSNIADLIPNPDFNPWYAKHLRLLGVARFMELANKARAGSETPQVIFKWMLNNHRIVR